MQGQSQDPITIPMEDELVHTKTNPFCSDPTCPDKNDPKLLAEVARQVENGLLTPDEATRTVLGRQL